MAQYKIDYKSKVGTYANLTFEDYLDVVPEENKRHLTKGRHGYSAQNKYCRRGGFYICCINPNHPDAEPSLIVRPGDDTAAIWKCFGSHGCDKQLIANCFNKLLIQHGKLIVEKQYTRTLYGWAENGVISWDVYNKIAADRERYKSKRREASSLHHAAAAINNQAISFEELQRYQSAGPVIQEQTTIINPASRSGSLSAFMKLRQNMIGGNHG